MKNFHSSWIKSTETNDIKQAGYLPKNGEHCRQVVVWEHDTLWQPGRSAAERNNGDVPLGVDLNVWIPAAIVGEQRGERDRRWGPGKVWGSARRSRADEDHTLVEKWELVTTQYKQLHKDNSLL